MGSTWAPQRLPAFYPKDNHKDDEDDYRVVSL